VLASLKNTHLWGKDFGKKSNKRECKRTRKLNLNFSCTKAYGTMHTTKKHVVETEKWQTLTMLGSIKLKIL
jgi:hypothetical protein